MVSVKTCLEAIMKEVGEVKRALAETHEEVRANEARAAAAKKAASGAANRAEEQFNHQGRDSTVLQFSLRTILHYFPIM